MLAALSVDPSICSTLGFLSAYSVVLRVCILQI